MELVALVPVLVLLVLAVFWLLVSLGLDWRITATDEPSSDCIGCGYSLQGLAAGTRCPECGQEDPARRRVRRREWFINPRAFASFFLMLAPVLAVGSAVPWLWYWCYRLTGWPESISRNIAGTTASADAVGAYLLAVVAAHPFAMLFGTRRRIGVGLLGAGLGCLGVVAAVAMHWRGGSVYASGCGTLVFMFTAGAVVAAGIAGRVIWPPSEMRKKYVEAGA